MIPDKILAEETLSTVLHARQSLDDSIIRVAETADAGVQRAYKFAVGKVMFEVFESIIEPIYMQHPDLIPESDRSWITERWERLYSGRPTVKSRHENPPPPEND